MRHFQPIIRIAECSEVHSKLQAHFSLNLQEMYDLGKHINNIKNAIRLSVEKPVDSTLRDQGEAGATQGRPNPA